MIEHGDRWFCYGDDWPWIQYYGIVFGDHSGVVLHEEEDEEEEEDDDDDDDDDDRKTQRSYVGATCGGLDWQKWNIRVKTLTYTVRTEIITELILERADPVIFKTFLLEIIALALFPVICPARQAKPKNCWKG